MSDENAAQTPGATEAPGQGSAPGNKEAQGAGGQVESHQKQDAGGDLPKGVKVELFKLRDARREAQAKAEAKEREAAELKARLDALEQKFAQGQRTTTPESVSPFDDPDAYAKKIREDARKEALEALNSREAEARRYSDAQHTEQWLLTRSHLKEDPKAVEEINAILVEKYADMASVNPRAAGRAAYLDFCESKGVVPDLGQRSTPAASGTVVRTSTAAPVQSSGPTDVKAIRKALMDPKLQVGSEAYKRLRAELEKSAKK